MLRWQPHRFVSYPVQVKRNAYRHVSPTKAAGDFLQQSVRGDLRSAQGQLPAL